jgi:hypothetical protein
MVRAILPLASRGHARCTGRVQRETAVADKHDRSVTRIGWIRALVMIAVLLAWSVCDRWLAAGDASVDASGTTAHATFTYARGAIKGDALLRETPNGIVLDVELADVEPGRHA